MKLILWQFWINSQKLQIIMNFLECLIPLDFLLKTWKTLGRFLVMFQIEMICLVLVLQKSEFQFQTSQNQSDVVSYVAEVLHANGIELVNAFFSQDNIVIILNEKDASRAYDILHSDIVRA